jgi:SET domain-containing protein
MQPVQAPRIDPQYACFDIEIRPSIIHRYGVYTNERIPANRKVIEYTGMRLNRKQASDIQSGVYTYLFAVDKYWTLDGARGGSGAEIINHSCEPNLISRVMKGHILYMSLRAIEPDEELTIDYNFSNLKEVTPCSCGARNCRGTIEKRKRPYKKAIKS